ncbi:polysaccharide biosynthesis tyrosine autokinase [Actinomycetospora callitridis]|uniref:polysaccharide biosynthesis tyrosine autokinase n=1 Tax=Actinomycetospora callitridis TaxID=913944 RepID=UPI002366C2D1|nr:polysaccharide biosynthesis tyrosine autokinase [Actinomycetospora callitridis]MDD7917666.1 Wzz/FepE/Etk N-terminal domain-containing protein [Actinomycetospora callitridis]
MSAREYWTVLREDRKLIAGVLVLCLLGAVLLDLLLPRTYTSSAVFYVASAQQESSSTDAYSGAQLSTERVKSYTELLQGQRVAIDASALLGGSPAPDEIQGAISASSVTETVVLSLDVTERSPDQARLVAGAVATAFTRLVGAIESTGGAVNRPIATAEVILPPTTPDEPSGPRTTILFAVALLVGLVVGIGVALARRALRDAIDSSETLSERLGAPVLGTVPALRRPPKHPALLSEPSVGAGGRRARRQRARAESYRRTRASLRSVAGERRCLVLTGTGSDQGTSTTAVDLAVAFAASGDSVVVVDADLRSPSLATTLSLDGQVGLREVLEQRLEPAAAIQRWSRGGFDVVTAGSPGSRPSELVVGPRLVSLLQTLRERYDHVLVDTPPVTDAADAVDIARHADGVVLVCRRGSTRPDDIDVAASALGLAGAVVLGAVLTWAVDVRDAPGGRRPVLALPAGPPSTPAPAAEPAPVVEETTPEPEPTPETGPTSDPAPKPRRPRRTTAIASDAEGAPSASKRPSRARSTTSRTRTTASTTASSTGEAATGDAAQTDHPTVRVRSRKTPAESAADGTTTAKKTPAKRTTAKRITAAPDPTPDADGTTGENADDPSTTEPPAPRPRRRATRATTTAGPVEDSTTTGGEVAAAGASAGSTAGGNGHTTAVPSTNGHTPSGSNGSGSGS